MKFIASALPLLTGLASATLSPLYVPTRIAFEELVDESVGSSGRLWKTLQDVGLISVTGIPGLNKQEMLAELEECVHGKKMDVPEFRLDDGTRRLTIGTRTEAGRAEDIFLASTKSNGARQEAAECIGLRDASVTFRAAVQRAGAALAARLGRYAGGATVLSSAAGDNYDIGEVIKQGDHLEHFHSYYTPDASPLDGNDGEDDTTIDWHIDQGLVLLFTPGQQNGAATSGFFIQLKDGSAVEVDFDEAVDDLVVMLGDGVNQYFNPVLKEEHNRLRAVPHALTLPKTTADADTNDSKPRLWYGRMVLPPSGALFRSAAGRHLQEDATFGDVRDAMIHQDATALHLGCASEHMVAREVHANNFASQVRGYQRGDLSVDEAHSSNDGGGGGCDPEVSIYCWMRCMMYNNTDYNPDQVTPDSCESEGEELMCAKDDMIWVPGLHDHGYGVKCGDRDQMQEATLKPTKSPTKSLIPVPVSSASSSDSGSSSDANTSNDDDTAGSCIYYASWHGRTEAAADILSATTGIEAINIQADGREAPPLVENFHDCNSIMVGTPTYNTSSVFYRSETNWDAWLYEVLPTLDISGKNVAVFCTGDQDHYDEYFCDAAGELYDRFAERGCNMFGFTSTDGYSYTKSKAVRNGQFIGQMFDQKNQADLSEERANAWVEQLQGEGFFAGESHVKTTRHLAVASTDSNAQGYLRERH